MFTADVAWRLVLGLMGFEKEWKLLRFLTSFFSVPQFREYFESKIFKFKSLGSVSWQLLM